MKNQGLELEVALQEMHKFLSIWKDDEQYTDDKIQKEYPDVLKALQAGLLVFAGDKMIPTYKLSTPIETKEGSEALSEVTFKTRVKPSTQANLADGLKLETQTLKYALRIMAFIIGQSQAMIDNLSKRDYNVIQQMASVFS